MSIPIKPTGPITGKEAEEFIHRMKEVDENPGIIELDIPEIDFENLGKKVLDR